MARVLIAVFGSLVLTPSASLAQDGRGSHGGGWHRGPGYSSGENVAAPLPPRGGAIVGYPYYPSMAVPVNPPGAAAVEMKLAASAQARVAVMAPAGAEVFFNNAPAARSEEGHIFTMPHPGTGQTTSVAVRISWQGNTRELRLSMAAGDSVTIDFRGAR